MDTRPSADAQKEGCDMQPPLSVRTTLPIRASFPVRHSFPSGILLRQASFPVRPLLCQAFFPVRHPFPSDNHPCQTSFSVRHSSPSGNHPCQASFSVRQSSPSGILLLSGILPFQSMDHIHHKLVAWHRYAYLCRGTDNRTADGIHLALPAVP